MPPDFSEIKRSPEENSPIGEEMSDLKEATVKNLSIIDPVQRRVLEKRYGLNGETAMAVDEVLAEMGSELVEYVKVRGLRSLHQAAEDDLSRS